MTWWLYGSGQSAQTTVEYRYSEKFGEALEAPLREEIDDEPLISRIVPQLLESTELDPMGEATAPPLREKIEA